MSLTARIEEWRERGAAALRRNDGPVRTVVTWSRWLFMPVAVGFILYAAWSSRELLRGVIEGARIGWLIASLFVWSILHLMVPLFDQVILRSLGSDAAYSVPRNIYLARLPTKYLPGGIWHNVTRLVDLNRAQVPKPSLTVLAVLQIVVPASVAFVIGGCLVLAYNQSTGWGVLGGVAAAIAAAALVLSPPLLSRTVLRGRRQLAVSKYVASIGLTFAFWVVAATGFYLYVSAYSVLPAGMSFIELAGSYLMAWGLGFISIFTPQGFGVFEATAASLITTNEVDFRAMIAIVAGFRLVVMASDTGAWLGFQALRKLAGRRLGGLPGADGARREGRHRT